MRNSSRCDVLTAPDCKIRAVALLLLGALTLRLAGVTLGASATAEEVLSPNRFRYLSLTQPRAVLLNHQPWEGKQFPHTLSVIELNRDGYRYWGWYGLNEGAGVGLARSNDLLHWAKYEKNPLLDNARWPSVVAHKPDHGS